MVCSTEEAELSRSSWFSTPTRHIYNILARHVSRDVKEVHFISVPPQEQQKRCWVKQPVSGERQGDRLSSWLGCSLWAPVVLWTNQPPPTPPPSPRKHRNTLRHLRRRTFLTRGPRLIPTHPRRSTHTHTCACVCACTRLV